MASRFEYKKTKSSFYELQKVHYILLYALLILILLFFAVLGIEKFVTGKNFMKLPFEVWHYVVLILCIPVPLLILLIVSKLDMVIDEDGVLYRWSPFDNRFHLLHWSAVKEVLLLDMKQEGLLWRWKLKHYKRFFLGGRYALEVRQRNGHTYIFSTRKPEQLQRALSRNAGEKFNQELSTIVFDYS